MRPSLRALALFAAAWPLVACSSSSSGDAAGGDAGEGGSMVSKLPRPDEQTATSNRAMCKYKRGDKPSDTLGASFPVTDQIPIDNIVVVMMENHSFDSYLGHLNKYANRTDVESAPDTATNPAAMATPAETDGGAGEGGATGDGGAAGGDAATSAGTVPYTHAPHLCTLDTDHSWSGTHNEIDNGLMDGFAAQNEGYNKAALPATSTDPSLSSGARALYWYDERDIPLYYKLASTFAIADHYHCSVPGPTWPNRRFLYAATSFGGTATPSAIPDLTPYPFPGDNPASLLDELETAKIPWMYYSDALALGSVFVTYGAAGGKRWTRTVEDNFAAFKTAAAAGKLPPVSFVDPDLTSELMNGNGGDEHPPGDIQNGQEFVSEVVQAVTSSPQWKHIALFITHDEHGGFYDHVAPPKACPPDDGFVPVPTANEMITGGFDLLGIRVILIAVSPYAKPAYVGHHIYDHTSITRFIEAKFNLPALTGRDANAEPLTDLFDFSKASFATPPSIPAATVDPTELQYCETTFGM
jgi:phospholipase C